MFGCLRVRACVGLVVVHACRVGMIGLFFGGRGWVLGWFVSS